MKKSLVEIVAATICIYAAKEMFKKNLQHYLAISLRFFRNLDIAYQWPFVIALIGAVLMHMAAMGIYTTIAAKVNMSARDVFKNGVRIMIAFGAFLIALIPRYCCGLNERIVFFSGDVITRNVSLRDAFGICTVINLMFICIIFVICISKRPSDEKRNVLLLVENTSMAISLILSLAMILLNINLNPWMKMGYIVTGFLLIFIIANAVKRSAKNSKEE